MGTATQTVLRWGQSAYETDQDLALERRGAVALGLGWRAAPESAAPPDLDGVDALVVTSRVKVGAAVLARFPGSLVLTTTSGWDHIDVQTARDRGITVARCPLARRDAVVETAVAGLVSMLRRTPAFSAAARSGRWARAELPALDPLGVSDAVVAVVGLGVIGRRAASVLGAMGARVVGVDPDEAVWAAAPPNVERMSLDDALGCADAVTLHCALTPDTRDLLSAERIAGLRPHVVVANTARGALVDVDALIAAVSSGALRGAVLDVFPEEPWPGLRAAAELDAVWLTPHAAGYTRGLGTRVAGEVEAALRAWVAGEPVPHGVDRIG